MVPSEKEIPLLHMRGVVKRFGSTLALEGVDLTVGHGEVHAVIGENGAGKSTLMNVLCGVIEPDEGEIELGGAPYTPTGPLSAARHGLAMIHQELSLAPHLSVEANILLGREHSRAGFLASRANLARAREALAQLERPDIDLRQPVGRLSMGERQLVEIARALSLEARVIVMDEPTSSLSNDDKRHLFAVIRRLRDRGLSVIYISHFLEEIEEICDRFTVLRDGRVSGSGAVAGTPRAELIRMMVGRQIEEVFPRTKRERGTPILRISSLSGRKIPRAATFELHRGEILGLAGLIGAGRTESLRAIFGLDPIASGEVRTVEVSGRDHCLAGGTGERIRNRIGMVSEDRKGEGLALNLSVSENLVMSSPRTVSKLGWVRSSSVRASAQRWIDSLSIRSATPTLPIRNLSGGNQQKVAIARLLQMEAEVFLLDEPTRGIDIGSKVEIYRLMDRLAAEGKAILFVSSHLPELLGVCDRIGVMSRGELTGLRPVSEWSEHSIMLAATGSG